MCSILDGSHGSQRNGTDVQLMNLYLVHQERPMLPVICHPNDLPPTLLAEVTHEINNMFVNSSTSLSHLSMIDFWLLFIIKHQRMEQHKTAWRQFVPRPFAGQMWKPLSMKWKVKSDATLQRMAAGWSVVWSVGEVERDGQGGSCFWNCSLGMLGQSMRTQLLIPLYSKESAMFWCVEHDMEGQHSVTCGRFQKYIYIYCDFG